MIPRMLASLVLSLVAAAVAAAPMLLQQPFGSQTPPGMALAHAARTWGSPLTIALAIVTIGVSLATARQARWWARALLIVPVGVALAAAWFARQNPFEWMFNPVARPQFVAADNAPHVEPGDVVLAVSRDDDAAAYPIRLIAYHHIVNDRIGRTPAVVTY